jgi:hypothetical protein
MYLNRVINLFWKMMVKYKWYSHVEPIGEMYVNIPPKGYELRPIMVKTDVDLIIRSIYVS